MIVPCVSASAAARRADRHARLHERGARIARSASSCASDAGGLSSEEAGRLLAERGRAEPRRSSRSYASIVRANVFTVFNLILAVAGALTLAFGDVAGRALPRDPRRQLGDRDHAGGAGEARARPARRARRADRDRRAGRGAATAAASRRWSSATWSCSSRATSSSRTARSRRASGLALDESILTGESDSVAAAPATSCAPARSWPRGRARYVVTAVGDASYAERVDRRGARASGIPARRSSGRSTGSCIVLVAAMVPLGALLGYALWDRQAHRPARPSRRPSRPWSRSCRKG